DCPGVSDVVLLESLVDDGPESRNVCARSFKHCKGRDLMVIIEIVVKAKDLLIVDTVVQLKRDLVAADRLNRSRHQLAAAIGGERHIREQVNRGRIQAAQRNDITWE